MKMNEKQQNIQQRCNSGVKVEAKSFFQQVPTDKPIIKHSKYLLNLEIFTLHVASDVTATCTMKGRHTFALPLELCAPALTPAHIQTSLQRDQYTNPEGR